MKEGILICVLRGRLFETKAEGIALIRRALRVGSWDLGFAISAPPGAGMAQAMLGNEAPSNQPP